MLPALPSQLYVFFLTVLSGVVTGFLLHYYQMILKKGRVGRVSLYVLDFSFWFLLILITFFLLLIINFAEIRVYIFIALLTGILVYFYFLSARLSRGVAFLAKITISSLRGIWAFFTWPGHRFSVWRQKRRALTDQEPEPPIET